MLMPFGIDTFSCHLDLLNYTDFQTWNNGAAPTRSPFWSGGVIRGLPCVWPGLDDGYFPHSLAILIL
jgi:hypothetical protein